MQKEPLVSAVIITYNQEKYIEQTIDCALAQKVDFDYEIVIGEDCSTDRTREICLRYQEKYPDIIRVITSNKNMGLMRNFYRTVKAARGKYFAVCGGDDFWHDAEKTKKQIEFLESNPNYGMVHSDENALFEDTGELLTNYILKNKYVYDNTANNVIDMLFLCKYRVVASSAVFRKWIFDEYYDLNELLANNIIIEDMPLFIITAAYSRVHYISESLVTRRIVKGSVTRRGLDNKLELLESAYRCSKYLYGKYSNKLSSNLVSMTIIHDLSNHLMFRAAFYENNNKKARFYYRRIVDLAGKSFVKPFDTIRYYLTYLPGGAWFCNSLKMKYLRLYEYATGIPVRQFF